MKKSLRLGVLSASLALATITGFAHHAFTPDFDWSKPITLKGTVTKVDWVAPHVLIQVSAKENDSTANWSIELGSPQRLGEFGWSETSLKVGDPITVEGWLAKNGRNFASAKSLKLANGKWLFGASSFFDIPYHASEGKVGTCVSDETCVKKGGEVSQR